MSWAVEQSEHRSINDEFVPNQRLESWTFLSLAFRCVIRRKVQAKRWVQTTSPSIDEHYPAHIQPLPLATTTGEKVKGKERSWQRKRCGPGLMIRSSGYLVSRLISLRQRTFL